MKILKKLKSKKGLLGVALALFYINIMLMFISSMQYLLSTQIVAADTFSKINKAYYAARAGIEYGTSLSGGASLVPIDMGTLANVYDVGFEVSVDNRTTDSALSKYEGIETQYGGTVLHISSTGWIKKNGTELYRKTLQAAYLKLSGPGRIIAWRELYSPDNSRHRHLAQP